MVWYPASAGLNMLLASLTGNPQKDFALGFFY